MTLMRVIASAKGLSEFAKQEQVVILRTVDNQRMAGLYDIAAIRQGAYADPAVYANDVVIIGDSPQRRLFRDVVSLAPLIAAPLVAALRCGLHFYDYYRFEPGRPEERREGQGCVSKFDPR